MSRTSEMIWRVDTTKHPPFTLPDWGRQGKGRFDCPLTHDGYRVLYAAESPRAALFEVMQRYRMVLSSLRFVQDSSPLGVQERDDLRERLWAPNGHIPLAWIDERRLCSTGIESVDPVLAISSAEATERLRYELADDLLALEVDDLDVSELTSLHRDVTQRISLWAWTNGYAGIRYPSRFGTDLLCGAYFEDRFEITGDIDCQSIRNSEDLLYVADTLRLHIPR